MSTNEQSPRQNGPSTNEQVPHSGVHGYETPVDTSHKTSLREADDQGLLEVPETPATLVPAERRGGKGKKIAAVVGSFAAVAALGFGAKTMMGGESSESGREAGTGQSAEAAPGAFKLGSASDYQSNPLQIVEDFFEIDNTWSNTGYGPDVPDDPRRGELGDDVAFAAEINGESDAQFAEEMLVSDWQNNPNLVEYYATSVRVHADNTALAIKTEPVKDGGFDAADTEPYIRYQTPDMSTAEVISSTDSEIVVQVEWDSGDNRDKNTAEDKITNGFDPNNESGESTLTFVEEDGAMRLADKQDS